MGRIFVAVGGEAPSVVFHEVDRSIAEQGRSALFTIRDLIVQNLRSHDYDAVASPDHLAFPALIDWINAWAYTGDVALLLSTATSSQATMRGAALHYIALNDQRKAQAELLLQAYLRRVPQIPAQGAKPDTTGNRSRLAFCRQVIVPALHMTIGHLSNADDRQLMQSVQADMALGIAEGLAAWSQSVSPSVVPSYPTLTITINGARYEDEGILVEGNPYIPIDLLDQLGVSVSPTSNPTLKRLRYRNIVYARTVDLKEHNLSIGWDSGTRSVNFRTVLTIDPRQLDRIMGQGNTSDIQMMMFLKSHNPDGISQFPDLPKLYREEAALEGVNHDIAFAQMCVETDFLRFGGGIKPEQNNFAGLGDHQGTNQGARFASARLGVRAQIQHLKAYASYEPLVQSLIDPRFQLVRRGAAPLVDHLSGRWAANADYGDQIKAIVRSLYEFADFL